MGRRVKEVPQDTFPFDKLADMALVEFIHSQLRSTAPAGFNTAMHDGCKVWSNWSASGWTTPPSNNSVENELINAIDNKYGFRNTRMELVYILYKFGYRQKEIAKILNVSIRTIKNDFKRIKSGELNGKD